jgi:hypothetical protein
MHSNCILLNTGCLVHMASLPSMNSPKIERQLIRNVNQTCSGERRFLRSKGGLEIKKLNCTLVSPKGLVPCQNSNVLTAVRSIKIFMPNRY